MRTRLILALTGLLMLMALPAHARFTDGEQKIVEAVKKAKPSVVFIETMHPASKKKGAGSGVILRKDGFILTNQHVIRNGRIIHVTLANGKVYNAQVWNSTPQYDLAVLKIEADNLPVPRFGDSNKLDLGQTAVAIGSPLRFSWTVTVGTISGLGRKVPYENRTYRNLIQTDAAINRGSSGGALIDSNGNVIGINTLVYTGENPGHDAQGIGFAIAINDALKLAQALVGRTAITPPATGGTWLGIDGKDVTADVAEMWDFSVKSGVLVTGVNEGSPAASAGIRRNDVITELGGTTIRSLKDLKAAVGAHKAGDTLEMVVWTNGKSKRTITVKLEATNPGS